MPFRVSPIAVAPTAVQFSTQAQNFNPEVIAGRGFVTIPKGWRTVGSPNQSDNPSRMVYTDAFRHSTTLETEGQILATTGRKSRSGAPLDHPATCVSWRRFVEHARMLNIGLPQEDHVMLPTAVEAEIGIRGPEQDILKFMEQNGLNAAQFIEYQREAQRNPGSKVAFENFVVALVEEVRIHNIDFNNTDAFKTLLDGATILLGSFVYGTRDGLLTPDNAWYSRPGTTSVSALKYVNGYGVPGTGHVWRITGDVYDENASSRFGKINPANPPISDTDNSMREIKGGSWDSIPQFLPAADRNYIRPDYDLNGRVGLVLVATASARTPG